MSFYPVLKAPGCIGQTTLCNFPPNNWENKSTKPRLVNLTWAHEGLWHTLTLGELAFGAMQTYTLSHFSSFIPEDVLPLLSLTSSPLPTCNPCLPCAKTGTHYPNWRATLALTSAHGSTSYQGELDPLPAQGSFLSFAPFLQFGNGIENFMLFLNLENNPQPRSSVLEIYNSRTLGRCLGSFEVLNNALSIISLDKSDLGPEDLPVIISRGMSGIPLYFSKTTDGRHLSLEHTHPPASYVIHGRRNEAQRILKSSWFAQLGSV